MLCYLLHYGLATQCFSEYVEIKANILLDPYLDTGTIFIILAAGQNIFMLQLYNEYGLKVHTPSFNLRVFTLKLEEMLRNYSSLI